MRKTARILTAIVLVLIFAAAAAFAQDSPAGIIAGSVTDGESGDAMIGAAVRVEGTNLGAICDLDGNFRITRVPVGDYTITCSMIGYNMVTVTEVVVEEGQVATVHLVLSPEAIEVEEVVVRAQAVKNTEAALLKDRQKADAVSDAVSAEVISQSGSSDAAAAMKQVTGASVDRGELYMRGLGDRYTSVQLNGSELPSANPNKRSMPMDLFPANLLDNIVAVKTFTPDKPGDFSGGTVDVKTKSYPDQFFFTVSASGSFNTNTTLNDDYLTYDGGDTDWLGMDDGTREIPDELDVGESLIPLKSQVPNDREKTNLLDYYSRLFNPVMGPETATAPFNRSLAISTGNQIELFGKPLGFLGSFTYSRNYSYYDEGSVSRWRLTGKVANTEALEEQYRFQDARGKDEVLWGGLFNVAYKFLPEHEIGVNLIYNQNAEDNARWLTGNFLRDLPPDAMYETSVLQYTERNLTSAQLHGEHVFTNAGGIRVEWKATLSTATQDEPDLRYFSSDYTIIDGEKSYAMRPNQYSLPGRYYRTLDDSHNDVSLDISIPFEQWSGTEGTFKFGTLIVRKDRAFRERRFEYNQDLTDSQIYDFGWDQDPYNLQVVDYAGDQDWWVDPSNPAFGYQDSLSVFPGYPGQYRFGVYVQDKSSISSNYDGDQDVDSYYGMVDMPIIDGLRLIGGARYEHTVMHVASQDTSRDEGNIDLEDVLPSVNLVYELVENMNFRAAYGRTLARPSLREMAPYYSFEFVGDYRYYGNPGIKRTLIDNYDFRWEWFSRPGEIYAASLFGKVFHDPIERVIQNQNGEIRYENVDRAVVYGIELESRKRLDIIAPSLEQFQVGGNLTLVHSEVDIAARELAAIRAVDPGRSSTREFQGQSPYIVNLNLNYDNAGNGLSAGLYYNVFGKRLTEISYGGTPYVYELPQHSLNFTFSKKLPGRLSLSGSVKNILNAKSKTVHSYKGHDYVARENTSGVSYSLGLKYSL